MGKSKNLADLGSHDVLDTHSTGIDVTGTVTADGLTVDGNVGIGTASPSCKMELLSGGTFDSAIRIGDTGSSRRLILEQTDVLNYSIGGTGSSCSTIFVSGGTAGIGTERMRIDASGRVTMPYQPAFMAYSSTHSTSGFYPFTSFSLPFTGGFNRGNHFNLSSGVFTVPVSGLYQINYTFHDTLQTTTRKIGRIYLNNIAVGYGELAEATAIYSDVGGAIVLNLSANDAIQWATHPLNWGGCTASAYLIG